MADANFDSKSFHCSFMFVLYNFGLSILHELLLDAIFLNNTQQDNFTNSIIFL